MSLQIVAYKGFALPDASGAAVIQVPDGPPISMTANSFTGLYTVPANCRLVKISGTGSITWDGVSGAEDFASTEFRGVRPGQTFTVA